MVAIYKKSLDLMLYSAGGDSTEIWMVLSSWAMVHKEGMWHTSYTLKGISDMERDVVTYKIAVSQFRLFFYNY